MGICSIITETVMMEATTIGVVSFGRAEPMQRSFEQAAIPLMGLVSSQALIRTYHILLWILANSVSGLLSSRTAQRLWNHFWGPACPLEAPPLQSRAYSSFFSTYPMKPKVPRITTVYGLRKLSDR